jgi:hypothetical protein
MVRWRPAASKTAVIVGVALLLAGPAAGLHHSLPSPLPSRGVLSQWERLHGEIAQEDGTSYAYELYVDPAHNGIYSITHYQVRHPATATVPALKESEKVIWNATPGAAAPLLLFERVDGHWRAMAREAPGYPREMMIVMHLYELHRQAADASRGK